MKKWSTLDWLIDRQHRYFGRWWVERRKLLSVSSTRFNPAALCTWARRAPARNKWFGPIFVYISLFCGLFYFSEKLVWVWGYGNVLLSEYWVVVCDDCFVSLCLASAGLNINLYLCHDLTSPWIFLKIELFWSQKWTFKIMWHLKSWSWGKEWYI